MSARLADERREHLLRVVRAAGSLDAKDETAPFSLTKRWQLLLLALPELEGLDEVDRTLLLAALEQGFRASSGYMRAVRPVAAAVHADADVEDTLVNVPRPIAKAKDRRYVYGPAKVKPLWRRLLGLGCLCLGLGCGGEVGAADVTGDAGDATDAGPAPLCVAPGIATCAPRWGYQCYPVVADAETLCPSAAPEIWCCAEYPLHDQ